MKTQHTVQAGIELKTGSKAGQRYLCYTGYNCNGIIIDEVDGCDDCLKEGGRSIREGLRCKSCSY